ncbi:MAG: CBS domain-containing protein [Brevinematales bacterium]|nr:CBS domain-containing protein [Brevinematales bacterium]
MANELDEVNVMTIAHPKPQMVSKDTPLFKAADKMLRLKIHSVIVVDDESGGKLLGVLSSLDIVKTAFLSAEKAKNIPVGTLIEGQKPYFVYQEVNVRDVLNLMVDKGIRSLPILNDQDKVAGIITMSDVLRLVKEKLV